MNDNIVKELLIKKKDVLKEIYADTLKANELLRLSKTEKLTDILNTRQKSMDKVDELDKKIAVFFGGDFKGLINYIDSSKQHKNTSNGVLTKIFEDTVLCLKKIVKLDEENKKLIMKLKSNLSNDIDNLNHAKSAMKGYGITGSYNLTGGAFIDTKK